MKPKKLVLVVEDDPDIVEILEYNIKRAGFDVIQTDMGKHACRIAKESKPALVLLDIMLPESDGIEVCKFLRLNHETRDIPIIMLTAKNEEEDIVEGLQAGADDYVTKPFRVVELMARIQAAIRRAQKDDPAGASLMKVGKLDLNLDLLEVKKSGRLVRLTKTEFQILWTLANHPGKVFTRKQLLEQIHGPGIITIERNVDVHVASLRRKLKQEVDFIETIRGIGYRSNL
ncbi:MAG: response regulator [Bdellovibrionota bacterium]